MPHSASTKRHDRRLENGKTETPPTTTGDTCYLMKHTWEAACSGPLDLGTLVEGNPAQRLDSQERSRILVSRQQTSRPFSTLAYSKFDQPAYIHKLCMWHAPATQAGTGDNIARRPTDAASIQYNSSACDRMRPLIRASIPYHMCAAHAAADRLACASLLRRPG